MIRSRQLWNPFWNGEYILLSSLMQYIPEERKACVDGKARQNFLRRFKYFLASFPKTFRELMLNTVFIFSSIIESLSCIRL